MENISLLLSQALTPYHASLGAAGERGERLVTVKDACGAVMIERVVSAEQLHDKRLLTDVVDGFHRDLLVAEGRLEPSMIAARRHVASSRSFTAARGFV